MIALLNLSVLGFSFVVFHDKTKRTQQGNLLLRLLFYVKKSLFESHLMCLGQLGCRITLLLQRPQTIFSLFLKMWQPVLSKGVSVRLAPRHLLDLCWDRLGHWLRISHSRYHRQVILDIIHRIFSISRCISASSPGLVTFYKCLWTRRSAGRTT